MHRFTLAIALGSFVLQACAAAPNTPTTQPTATPIALEARTIATSTPVPPASTPLVGFTPQTTQRNSSGVPLPYAPNNYFFPQETRVTVGSTVEWDYNGGGGETESIHNVVASNNVFSSGDLNPGSRFAYTFKQPGAFDYVCTYHVRQMTAKIVVVE